MMTFLIGLVLLVVGGAAYGRVCERVMKPTDASTPATAMQDGVDFVPMGKWRNSLIELLNIAGTGPILGPIQGALFGPVAFVTILLVSAVGVFAGLFVNGYPLPELWGADPGFPLAGNFVPVFFVTVTCGILSGFHSTQATIVSRTVADEREGRATFYDMMVAEGFIAMTWAAAYVALVVHVARRIERS